MPRPACRPPRRPAVLALIARRGLLAPALAAGALLAACSRSASGPGPVPAAITIQGGNNQTATVLQALPTQLSVAVTDASGKPVPNRRVDWDVAAGAGTLSPTASNTNASGVATTTWTAGSVAGTIRIAAQIAGLNPAVFTATIVPGAAASVVATPDLLTLGVGDTLRVRGAVRDALGNTIQGQTIAFSSLTPSIVSIDPTTGLVTALSQGAGRVVAAEASGRADTVPVTVGAAGSVACGALAPVSLALGEVRRPAAGASSIGLCITGPATGTGDYALALISTGSSFGTSTILDVHGIGNTLPATAALTLDPRGDVDVATAGPLLLPEGHGAQDVDTVQVLETARREMARRELAPLVGTARDWYASRNRFARAVADPKVGDVIKLNTNASVACSSPDTRSGRVAAVSARAMVVADVNNPAGGYTDADYQSVLATFDTLVFPMDTTAFGAPSNISSYGRVILFFTKAVNELTPRNATFTIGGFFFARDLYPKKAANGLAACAGSNENEMFYLLVPDPNGEVNGNRRTKDEVTLGNITSIAHELQHLINSSRRLYVNTGAEQTEVTWLDEGLAHIAEELLYFRVAGFGDRQNLVLADVAQNATRQSQFNTYASSNFFRFQRFLTATEGNSPYAPNDSLATRGATWNFLRYAAARQGAGNEAAFFRALVNSRTSGLANLQSVLSGGTFGDYLADWSVALIADDHIPATTAALDPRYTNPAWSFRSIYPGLRIGSNVPLGVYPISARLLNSNVPQRLALAGGTSSYIRFAIPAGRTALITLGANGALPPSTVRYSFVRVR
ncbi:MAG: Ig-like domain-containing protein [Gemmatimonadetes bacterium]|nr:Ig-like domain-containing protein [Gemmatimonadota bacterium]